MTCVHSIEGKKILSRIRGKVFPARGNLPRIKPAEAPTRQGKPEPPSGPSKTKSGGRGDFSGKTGG